MPTAFDAGRAVSLVFVSKLNGTVDSMVFQQQQQDAMASNSVAVDWQQCPISRQACYLCRSS